MTSGLLTAPTTTTVQMSPGQKKEIPLQEPTNYLLLSLIWDFITVTLVKACFSEIQFGLRPFEKMPSPSSSQISESTLNLLFVDMIMPKIPQACSFPQLSSCQEAKWEKIHRSAKSKDYKNGSYYCALKWFADIGYFLMGNHKHFIKMYFSWKMHSARFFGIWPW